MDTAALAHWIRSPDVRYHGVLLFAEIDGRRRRQAFGGCLPVDRPTLRPAVCSRSHDFHVRLYCPGKVRLGECATGSWQRQNPPCTIDRRRPHCSIRGETRVTARACPLLKALVTGVSSKQGCFKLASDLETSGGYLALSTSRTLWYFWLPIGYRIREGRMNFDVHSPTAH